MNALTPVGVAKVIAKAYAENYPPDIAPKVLNELADDFQDAAAALSVNAGDPDRRMASASQDAACADWLNELADELAEQAEKMLHETRKGD